MGLCQDADHAPPSTPRFAAGIRRGRAPSEIARIIAGFSEHQRRQRLRVTALSAVASRWLTPRLPRFLDLYPEIEVQVIADAQLLDLRSQDIDLAVRFGRGRYPRHSVSLLMRDRVLPVCSPTFLAEHGRPNTH
jgi:LysR family transcriptional regulator, glycine cleavage system transcriptional activator